MNKLKKIMCKYINYFYIKEDIKYGETINAMPIMTEREFFIFTHLHDELFPDTFLKYSEYSSIYELKKILPCGSLSQLDWVINNDWYLLLIRHFDCIEIYELAGRRCSFALVKAYQYIVSKYYEYLIKSTVREATVYPAIKLFHEKGKIRILKDRAIKSQGEVFHNITFIFLKR